MLNFAYADGFNTPDVLTDDNDCSDSGNPCTEYNYTGRSSTHRYYGYFDPNKWYTYASNVFNPVAGTMDNVAKQSNYWSGDFLNWLTMRRIDVMRKVLTGGRPNGTKIDGEVPDWSGRGIYKRITAAEANAYTPYSTVHAISTSTRGPPGRPRSTSRRFPTAPPWTAAWT